MNVRSSFAGLAALAGALALAACNSSEPAKPAASTPASAPPAAAASTAAQRVFFVEPTDGATVKSPVHLKFGVQGLEISPVPAGDVTSARAGMGHHHVGVDTDCLPPGTAIPKASPWVHFGKGDAEMDMQLPPGSHKLTLEIGDDMHMTQPGMCSTITVNVTQ
jgi:uncharacterized protein DUF4399/uncharacterized protein DUF6130